MLRKWFSKWGKVAKGDSVEVGCELAPEKNIVTVKPMPSPEDIGQVTLYVRDFETPPSRKPMFFSRYPY